MGRLNKKLTIKKKPSSSVDSKISPPGGENKTVDKAKRSVSSKPVGQRASKNEVNLKSQNLHKIQKIQKLQKFPKKQMNKKEKQKLKRNFLVSKLSQDAKEAKEEKFRKIRGEKNGVMGDTQPLRDIMADILAETELPESKEGNKPEAKKKRKVGKGTLKEKKRMQEMKQNIQFFNQVKKHPDFVKDPFAAISTHIQNKMLMEA